MQTMYHVNQFEFSIALLHSQNGVTSLPHPKKSSRKSATYTGRNLEFPIVSIISKGNLHCAFPLGFKQWTCEQASFRPVHVEVLKQSCMPRTVHISFGTVHVMSG